METMKTIGKLALQFIGAAAWLFILWATIATLSLVMRAQTTDPLPPVDPTTTTEPKERICRTEVQADGTTLTRCQPVTVSGSGERDYRDWYTVCYTQIVKIRTIISIDSTTFEFQLVDLDKFAAATTPAPSPTNPNPVSTASKWDVNFPWQMAEKFIVTHDEWMALAPDKRWAWVKGQPPTQYGRVAVSGACMLEVLRKLRMSTDVTKKEPL